MHRAICGFDIEKLLFRNFQPRLPSLVKPFFTLLVKCFPTMIFLLYYFISMLVNTFYLQISILFEKNLYNFFIKLSFKKLLQ